jgi:hypothetical protein
MIQSFSKVNKVSGRLSLLGDKSISHRALLISSLADGKSVIRNLSDSDDVFHINASGLGPGYKPALLLITLNADENIRKIYQISTKERIQNKSCFSEVTFSELKDYFIRKFSYLFFIVQTVQGP